MSKKVSILGSSGSIGTQALDVISKSNDRFEVQWLTVNRNIELLEKQCSTYSPKGVVIADENSYQEFVGKTSFKGKILKGEESLIDIAADSDNDLVISSLVGFSGVAPTLSALKKGTDVALANKETLVSAGALITKEARENNAKIIAVDSEHNAILQCLVGEESDEIEKIILTASGGPFRETSKEDFSKLTVEQALDHPNWSMGSKITIDSATMMNKGLEVIEAFWLFDVEPENIEVVVHPQSIIHSMVQFIDGSVKAQLGLPDMRVPISYALTYPRRFNFDFPRLDLTKIVNLTFEKPDLDKFKCLDIAFQVIKNQPELAAIMNAANEIAVDAFLSKRISFDQISSVINETLHSVELEGTDLESITDADLKSRSFAKKLIEKNAS